MGYQLDDARTRNGRTIWVPCLQVASQKPTYINGIECGPSRKHGINGIECGPFRNAVYGWTWEDSRNP